MAAVIALHVYTSASADTESACVAGVDFISADNATNTLANRQSNPVSTCSFSYEKWLKLKITESPDNSVSNFLVWGDAANEADTDLMWGLNVNGSTPVNSESTIATSAFSTYTSDAASKLTWDSGSYEAATCTLGTFLVMQLEALTAASAGNWTQETISYSYDEK